MTLQQQKRRNNRRRLFYLKRAAALGAVILLTGVLVLLLLSCTADKATEPAPQKAQAGQTRAVNTAKPISRGEAHAAQSVPTVQSVPDGWKQIDLPESALAEGTLVLVNNQIAFDASIPDTVSVYDQKDGSYLVKDIYLSVTQETMDALNEWMDAFAAETGIRDVNIVAGWRSFQDQTGLYENAVSNRGQAYADAYIALPGHSEHHTGLAVDLDTYDVDSGASGGFDGRGDYAWAVEHAWEFGFIQRYPESKSDITGINFESWHFRYVGLPHAYVMTSEKLCLEEYIDYLRGYPFSGEHLFVTCFDNNYEIYFCSKDQVVVPSSGDYRVSGNNVDGFIVVIELP